MAKEPLMCLNEVDCDLKYSGLRRESHVIASYCEDFDRRKCPWCNEKTGYIRRKIRVHELIRGSLSNNLKIHVSIPSLKPFACFSNNLTVI
jgi:hypothetical protein